MVPVYSSLHKKRVSILFCFAVRNFDGSGVISYVIVYGIVCYKIWVSTWSYLSSRFVERNKGAGGHSRHQPLNHLVQECETDGFTAGLKTWELTSLLEFVY